MSLTTSVLAGTSLLFFALTGNAQTWFKVAAEDPSASATLPAGTVYRLGSGTCWSDPVTVTKLLTLTVYWPTGIFPFADPCPGVAKELDIQETATAQTVTVSGQAVTVPALPPPPPPPPAAPTVTGTYTCRVQIYSDGTFTADNCTVVN